MAHLGDGDDGYLDVENATIRAPRLEAVSNIGIANTNPQHAFSVGSNLYVSTESSDVLTIKGNVVTEGIKMGFLEITPSYDLAAVSNVGNITSNTIIFDNPTQGFVASGNATIGSTLTISGFRITAAAAAEDDLQAITTAGGDTTNTIRVRNGTESTSFDTGALQVGTNTGANGGLGVAGNVHVAQGVYTQDLSVSGDIVSNLAVNTDDLFVDIVNSRVGIGKTEPTVALDVVGAVNASGNVAVDTNTLFVDSVNNKVGIGVTEPGATLEVTGNAYVSSNLEVGTANLFVDTVNSRVGIGTTSPECLLHLSSATGSASIVPTKLKIHTTTEAGDWSITDPWGVIEFDINDTSFAGSGPVAGIGVRSGDTTGGYPQLCFYTDNNESNDTALGSANERMVIDHNGNVGIGTSDPGSYKLDVNGTAHLPSIHRTNFTKELSEYFELVSGTTSTVTLNSLLVEINVTGAADADQSEYSGTIDLDILAQRTNSAYGMDVVKTQLHFAAAWNEQSDGWNVLEFNQEIKAQNINSYRTITSVPVFRYTYIARKLQIYIQYNALQYRVKHSFTARVSSDEAFAGDIISYAGGGPMSGTDSAAVQGLCYGIGGKLGTGTNAPIAAFNLKQSADNSPAGSFIISPVSGSLNYWGMYVSAGNDFMFHQNGSDRGFLDSGVNVTAIDFTGQHRNFIDGIPATNYTDFEGLIVSANKNKYYDINEDITTGANAIQISQSLPLVALSNVALDKACFGVISGVEDPDTRTYEQGTFVTVLQKQTGDRRAFINSVGEGAIWVTDINGHLESGDYITTSNVAGYGQKQDSEFLANYTVAKITMDCDFEPVTQPIQIIRKEMGDVNYWVKTTYENISEEEYSNLTEENRRTIDGIYQKITKEESKTEQEGYELEVRQELVNVLDEHGQIQWEDTDQTEKAYKIRYLDADGVETDEANHVHKAAFVGCTYHCG